MRKTIGTREMKFDSRENMLKFGREIILDELGFDINEILKKSKLLKSIRTQKKLNEFFC